MTYDEAIKILTAEYNCHYGECPKGVECDECPYAKLIAPGTPKLKDAMKTIIDSSSREKK